MDEFIDTGKDPARPLVFLRGCDVDDAERADRSDDDAQRDEPNAKVPQPPPRRAAAIGTGAVHVPQTAKEALAFDLDRLVLPPINFTWADLRRLGISVRKFLFHSTWRDTLTRPLCERLKVTVVELMDAGLAKKHVVELGQPFGFWHEVLGASEIFLGQMSFTEQEWETIGWNEVEFYNYTGYKIVVNKRAIVDCQRPTRPKLDF